MTTPIESFDIEPTPDEIADEITRRSQYLAELKTQRTARKTATRTAAHGAGVLSGVGF